MADLITLPQLRAAMGPDADAYTDSVFMEAISDASSVVRDYTGRNFGAPDTIKTVTYRYDGQGWLDIDDASVVTAVALDGQTLTVDRDYVLGPDRGFFTYDEGAPQIYSWVELPRYVHGDPAMGFMYNLDTLWWRYKNVHTAAVTGTFGWIVVPRAVQRATILVVTSLLDVKRQVLSESIDAYSHTYDPIDDDAIPGKAKSLLDPYKRW